MPKTPADVILDIRIDSSSDVPLYRQVYGAIKELILAGRLRPGARLPATRTIATDLGLSRTTILNAIDQLALEGFVVGKIGSGTRVSTSVQIDRQSAAPVGATRSSAESPRLAQRTRQIAIADPAAATHAPIPLRPGHPAIELLPLELWARLTAKYWRGAPATLSEDGGPRGVLAPREGPSDPPRRRGAGRG